MNWDNMVTAIFNWLGALSWPVAVIILICIFKRPISELLARLKSAEGKGMKFVFGDKIPAYSEDDNTYKHGILQPLPTPIKEIKGVAVSKLSDEEIEQSRQNAQKRLDEDTKRAGYQRGELFQLDNGKWAIAWNIEIKAGVKVGAVTSNSE